MDNRNGRPDRLRQLKIPLLADTVCSRNDVWGSYYNKNSMMCAGSLSGGSNFCSVIYSKNCAKIKVLSYLHFCRVILVGHLCARLIANGLNVVSQVSFRETDVKHRINQAYSHD